MEEDSEDEDTDSEHGGLSRCGPRASHGDGNRAPKSARESCCKVSHRSVVVVFVYNSETC